LGRFSPDGRWVAFQSNRNGQYEIWVLPFPAGAADPIRVSVRGGTQPRWPRQGHELFYIDGDNRLMAVEVSTAGGFRASTPSPLFRIRPSGVDSYDVTLDGKRFLVAMPEDEASSKPATVVLNWSATMRR
jgi:Tol biopolymer transport system component